MRIRFILFSIGVFSYHRFNEADKTIKRKKIKL